MQYHQITSQWHQRLCFKGLIFSYAGTSKAKQREKAHPKVIQLWCEKHTFSWKRTLRLLFKKAGEEAFFSIFLQGQIENGPILFQRSAMFEYLIWVQLLTASFVIRSLRIGYVVLPVRTAKYFQSCRILKIVCGQLIAKDKY